MKKKILPVLPVLVTASVLPTMAQWVEFLPPVLRVEDVGALSVESMEVKAEVRGLFAQVETTLVFRNPNARVLEGMLEFPLPDRGVVCGYGLDVNGVLVDGVVVPKDEARVILETEVRRQVDPGLVEQVKGNVYRTRVYPIPAKGTRTVKVTYSAPLVVSGGDAALSLPMPREALQRRLVSIDVVAPEALVPQLSGLGDRRFEQAEQVWRVRSEEANVTPGDDILVALPKLGEAFSMVERDEKGVLWRSDVTLQKPVEAAVEAELVPQPTPKVEVYWDASGSRSLKEAEVVALETALSAFEPQEGYRLVVFRNQPEAAQEFPTREALLAAVKGIEAYDGGTSFRGLWEGASAEGVKLLFSDGLDTLSSVEDLHEVKRSEKVLAFTSSTVADFAFLRRMGTVVKLHDASMSAKQTREVLRLWQSPVDAKGSGMLEDALDIGGLGWNARIGKVASAEGKIVSGRVLATVWAAARMEELASNPDANEDELLGLGRRYGLVGPKTSLLVLDTLEQWVRYKIQPPETLPEMRAQWEAAMKTLGGGESEEAKVARHREMLKRLWDERVAWWKTDFRKRGLFSAFAPSASRRGRSEAQPIMDSDSGMEDGLAMESVGRLYNIQIMSADDAVSEEAEIAMGEPESEHASVAATAKVAAWDPDVPYLKEVRAAKGAESRYAAYLKARKENASSPAFYLDCAAVFFRKGERELAIRIVTNLAELKLEDASLLRVLGWRLREAEEYDAALIQLRRIARLRPEDGQSFRDIAFTLAERGKAHVAAGKMALAVADLSEALETYRQVAFTPWIRHADTLGLFALEEFNALAAWVDEAGLTKEGVPERVVVPEVPDEFRERLSTDIRIVMEWDADNTDIDLHVVEPNGEEAYYANNRTKRGGLVSRDVVDGYGPEEYMIRRASKGGTYEISAKYYGSHQQTLLGPATVTATVYTNWGRKEEKRLTMSLRLEKQGDRIPIGSVTFPK